MIKNKLDVKKLRIWTIICLALIAAILILFIPMQGPSGAAIASFGKSTPINLEDKCGKFINLFSHTIEDKKACEIQCKSKCDSSDKSYRKADFKEIEGSCNSCMCYCR